MKRAMIIIGCMLVLIGGWVHSARAHQPLPTQGIFTVHWGDPRIVVGNVGQSILWRLPDGRKLWVELEFASDGSLSAAYVDVQMQTGECESLGPAPLQTVWKYTDSRDTFVYLEKKNPTEQYVMVQARLAHPEFTCVWFAGLYAGSV
jgi:hypothetical protein